MGIKRGVEGHGIAGTQRRSAKTPSGDACDHRGTSVSQPLPQADSAAAADGRTTRTESDPERLSHIPYGENQLDSVRFRNRTSWVELRIDIIGKMSCHIQPVIVPARV